LSFLFNSKKRQSKSSKGFNWITLMSYLTLLFFALIIIVPLMIILFAAFKTPSQIATDFPLNPPSELYLKNIVTAFFDGKIPLGFKNSLIIVIVSDFVNILIGTTTAYAIGRFDFKLKKVILGIFMLAMMLPGNLTEIPRFIVMHKIGAYDTLIAPCIIYASTDVLQLYIYLQFLEKIPYSLDESAMLDGCSYFGIFRRIILPLMTPAIATLTIIKTVWVMNDMFIPYLYMPSKSLRTLTTTLMDFSSSKFATWNNLSAAIIIVTLPTVLLFIFLQKYIFAGIVAGSVKE